MTWFSSTGSKPERVEANESAKSKAMANSPHVEVKPGLGDGKGSARAGSMGMETVTQDVAVANQDLESIFSRFFADKPTEANHASASRTRSTLPAELNGFASVHPFTTVAAIGAMATAVFLGSVSLTARLLRGGPRPKLSPALDKRLESMERRMIKRLQDVQKKGAEASEITRIAALEQIGSVRLSEVEKYQLANMTAAKIMADRHDLEEYVEEERSRDAESIRDSLNEMKSISEKIFEEIMLLKAAQAANPAQGTEPQMPADGVWSMGELSKMVEQFQAQTLELNAAESTINTNPILESKESRPEEVEEPSSFADKEVSEEEAAINRAVYGYDIGGQEESLEVVAEELSKSAKAKKKRQAKKAKAALAAKEDEGWEVVESDGSSGEMGVTGGIESGVTQAESVETSPHQASPVPSPEAIAKETAQEAIPPPGRTKSRKRTALPTPDPINDPAPESAARLGIDDSGGWSFQILSVLEEDFPAEAFVPIRALLTERTQMVQEVQSRQWAQQHVMYASDEISRQTVAMLAYRNPDVQLIELDGAIWRVEIGDDGDYTIVEKMIQG